jgi:hypothetical protein
MVKVLIPPILQLSAKRLSIPIQMDNQQISHNITGKKRRLIISTNFTSTILLPKFLFDVGQDSSQKIRDDYETGSDFKKRKA